MTSNDEKIPLLLGLVRGWSDARIMVFVNTKREADRVWGYLQGNGINTAVLSGDVPQNKRLKLLRDFTDGTLPVLVGTDVAARGLHIPDVTHVVNYDLPEDPEDYVHRIGRTARAGAAGDAIGFVCETHAFCLPDIETFIGAKIPVLPVDPALAGRGESAQPAASRPRGSGAASRGARAARSRARAWRAGKPGPPPKARTRHQSARQTLGASPRYRRGARGGHRDRPRPATGNRASRRTATPTGPRASATGGGSRSPARHADRAPPPPLAIQGRAGGPDQPAPTGERRRRGASRCARANRR